MQNRRNSSKYKGYSSLEYLSYLEGEGLRNRLLRIYSPMCNLNTKPNIIWAAKTEKNKI